MRSNAAPLALQHRQRSYFHTSGPSPRISAAVEYNESREQKMILTSDMPNQRMPRHRIRHIRQTHNQLHFIPREPTRLQTRLYSGDIVPAGPSDLLGTLDDARIARKERSEDGGDEVVEGIVPGYAGEGYAEWGIVDL